MSALAEDSIDRGVWKRRALQWGGALVAIVLVAALAWWLKGLGGNSTAPKRQVARISILPDTPPPPKEEKPPPPRDEPKQVVREEQLKAAEAPKPANEPLKMEGAAGDGPSAFAAGSVRNEYSGGPPSTGAPAAAGGTGSDRARERFFANSARQLLRDEIERHLRGDSNQATAEFTLWIERDGAIQRFVLQPTGNSRLDGELQAALDETRRTLRLPAPPTALQPMKFRLTLRPQG